jgi:hypothetical protein
MERSYEIQVGCLTNDSLYDYDDLDSNVANLIRGKKHRRRDQWQPTQLHRK